jgi:hypothetical protein
MKYILFILCCVIFTSCSAQRIKVQKASGGDVHANCTDCVKVRIKNRGVDPISKVVLTTEGGEYHFDGIKPGKAGVFKLAKKLCSCGYGLEIHYVRSAKNATVITRNCQNIMPCTDYFAGNAEVVIKADKLPEDLTSKEAKRVNVDVEIRNYDIGTK